MKNLRFNRVEKKGRHEYFREFTSGRQPGGKCHAGYIKCKLVHNQLYSLVIPDQIYVDVGGALYWIQPLYFMGNIIAKRDDGIICRLHVDVSFGEPLSIEFKSDAVINRFDDGSLIYRCTINGPMPIHRYGTGPARIIDKTPFIKLFHHTSEHSKRSIIRSGEFWSSSWNLQGTKKSTNISYLYLTSLPRIECIDDLVEIAMSSNGKIALRVDQNFSSEPDLVMKVYRESTINRTAAIPLWVDASLLSTQPVYRHALPGEPVYYEVVAPFVHRLGVEPDTTIRINKGVLIPAAKKNLAYAVVGDATTISGLEAPYDEEHTSEILKIEMISEPVDICEFWISNANSDQFSWKAVERAVFG